MLPALLFSLLFFLPAWFLWRRDRRGWALVPLATALLLLTFTFLLFADAANHRQTLADTRALLRQLAQPDLLEATALTDADEQLFLVSTATTALLRSRPLVAALEQPRADGLSVRAIDSTLAYLAAWLTKTADYRATRRNADWDREVFYLAHAGAILLNYQLATGQPDYEATTKAIGRHLGRRLERSRYKHLISRPTEEFYRPADNAAAVFTLRLHDELFGTTYAADTYQDWSRYLADELYYAESRLPCAAFSPDNRCHLEPSATATGLYVAYRAAAVPPADDIPWREWLHYFAESSLSPFSVTVRPGMRDGRQARFCSQGAAPLDCGRYENAIGLWAAAEFEGEYAFFRLYSTYALRRWFLAPVDYAAYRPTRRVHLLTEVALRTMGTARW